MTQVDVPAAVQRLIDDEGLRLTVYDDATGEPIGPGTRVIGHPTIAIGRTLDIRGIGELEARMLVADDITVYLASLEAIPWFAALDPVRQRAIISMRHQLGMSGLLGFRLMISAIMRRDWETAAREGLASSWAVETPARASRMMEMIRTGQDPVRT